MTQTLLAIPVTFGDDGPKGTALERARRNRHQVNGHPASRPTVRTTPGKKEPCAHGALTTRARRALMSRQVLSERRSLAMNSFLRDTVAQAPRQERRQSDKTDESKRLTRQENKSRSRRIHPHVVSLDLSSRSPVSCAPCGARMNSCLPHSSS